MPISSWQYKSMACKYVVLLVTANHAHWARVHPAGRGRAGPQYIHERSA